MDDVAYPAAEDVVAYLKARQPRLAAPADSGKPLALQPRAFVALVAFLRRCRAKERSGRGSGSAADAGADSGGDVDMLSHTSAELPTEYMGACLGHILTFRDRLIVRLAASCTAVVVQR